jgi:hypothetical protein
MLIMRFGGYARAPLYVNLMQAIAWVMVALLVWLFHGPWRAFKRAADAAGRRRQPQPHSSDHNGQYAARVNRRHHRRHRRALGVVDAGEHSSFTWARQQSGDTAMRGFGKRHAEHMNPRPDERVVRLMRHLREAFDIFEQPMLSAPAPPKPAEPMDDKQLREATIRLEQAQQRAAGPDVPMMVKPKAALKLMSISNTKLYEMIKTGELETFKRGGSRYIPVAAINDYIARSLAANKARTDAGVQVGNRLGKNHRP